MKKKYEKPIIFPEEAEIDIADAGGYYGDLDANFSNCGDISLSTICKDCQYMTTN